MHTCAEEGPTTNKNSRTNFQFRRLPIYSRTKHFVDSKREKGSLKMAEDQDLVTMMTILQQTVTTTDTHELELAQKFLEQAAQENFNKYLALLAQILANASYDAVPRMAAGLQLKNALTSKSPEVRALYQQRWLALDNKLKTEIKLMVLQSLGTETHSTKAAAQCVACIACTEIPVQSWPDLIPHLLSNVTSLGSTEALREATLEAIGYICQDIEPEHLQSQCNEMLTAIVQGMRVEEESFRVKLAATTALLNSLEFTKANFEKEAERHYIMQVVCEATQCKDMQVEVAALQCLVKIMSLYYQYMEAYMGPALFAITVEAMKSQNDEVALQGIEFWSNVCDEEMDLAIEASEAQEQGRVPEHSSQFYAKGALAYLVPILTTLLAKQEEFDDEDDWIPCKAAGVCLMLLANCCENDIIHLVLPFVNAHINSEEWRLRDAAVMSFGSILEGPDPDCLKPAVTEVTNPLIGLLRDESVVVRDTVAWTLGRICELLPEAILNDKIFPQLLEALVVSLDAEPRVAANICWAFSSLAESAYETALRGMPEEGEPTSYCLSSSFEVITKKLVTTADRSDAHQANLRNAAYEALMELMKNSAQDCYPVIQGVTKIVLERIKVILQMESHVHSSERIQYNDLQSLLCATLQSVLRKMKLEDVKAISDEVMMLLLQMFNSGNMKSGGVREDALLAVGTLVEVLGVEFLKYVEVFKVHLFCGLDNIMEYQVCLAAVGLVGDMCRALNTHIAPLCDDIMQRLMTNLRNEHVHRTVKPQILSVFGDIALAIGPAFMKYLPLVMETLQQASQTKVDKTDYDMIDCLNELREGCVEAYTGIIQGLKSEDDSLNPELESLFAHVSFIIAFIEEIAGDEDHTDGIVGACAGLIGDLCSIFKNPVADLMDRPLVQEILTEGRRSKNSKTKSLAFWASKAIRKAKNPQQ
ncbi:importin subunit beta-1-like [Patiria miniata]|uniref:Importin N-terminal domain-containing protein n=1 Tax=Patiria miniata TaxID=46514 RepID=A0A913ZCZ9_PATMI|nr:importin subunit beta-1-like [Patiria miniata]